MNSKPTCGPLYKAGLDNYCGDDPERVRLFAAGFVSGQAEKVYLGACRAAMFRPSAERLAMLMTVVKEVAERYGLVWLAVENEVWLCRDRDAERTVKEMAGRIPNSPGWHRLRADLCGVPRAECDEYFHLRHGYGQRCD